jgi:hypothetical protein
VISAREFEEFARECMRLACETRDDHIREKLIDMARSWMQLVREEEDKLGGPGPYLRN